MITCRKKNLVEVSFSLPLLSISKGVNITLIIPKVITWIMSISALGILIPTPTYSVVISLLNKFLILFALDQLARSSSHSYL